MPEQTGPVQGAAKGLLEQMEELMAALDADLSALAGAAEEAAGGAPGVPDAAAAAGDEPERP